MDELVSNLLEAFGTSIDELRVDGPATRREAHAKLTGFTVKIGYPEKWKEYPGSKCAATTLWATCCARAR